MDVALENAQTWAAEGATRKAFCEISQAKGQSGKPMWDGVPFYPVFSINFVFPCILFFQSQNLLRVWLFSLFARMRRDWDK